MIHKQLAEKSKHAYNISWTHQRGTYGAELKHLIYRNGGSTYPKYFAGRSITTYQVHLQSKAKLKRAF
jgi:hypothetical protein